MTPALSIVVLDGHTLNPGDLSWEAFQALGPCTIFERTLPSDVVARVQHTSAIFTNKTVITRSAIEQLPALRYIGVLATGYNVVDIEAARQNKIIVTNVPAYSTDSVTQLVFALMLELTHRVGHHSDVVRQGRWSNNPDFSFCDHPLMEIAHKTLGLVGYGRIGLSVARVARAFNMRVIACTRTPKPDETGVEFVSLDDVFEQSDFVSLHCPLNDATRLLINAARIDQMKRTAYLINTSRGPLIQERDLAHALESGRIAGAGLDVLSTEPPPVDHCLLRAKNCIITPHFGWATHAARTRLMQAAVKNLKAFLEGAPINVVNS